MEHAHTFGDGAVEPPHLVDLTCIDLTCVDLTCVDPRRTCLRRIDPCRIGLLCGLR
ncbi:hypothetical protein [Streptomyces sp. bgisy100]|uniref:hypothetical protein n=1 Tax=Streptomyces sp. bgisy100 TaxID=3413783 RepID=UPI003D71E9CC